MWTHPGCITLLYFVCIKIIDRAKYLKEVATSKIIAKHRVKIHSLNKAFVQSIILCGLIKTPT